jgi:hypothetical protein
MGAKVLHFELGTAEDQGATWKFMDGIAIAEDNIQAVIPGYAGGALPPKSREPAAGIH